MPLFFSVIQLARQSRIKLFTINLTIYIVKKRSCADSKDYFTIRRRQPFFTGLSELIALRTNCTMLLSFKGEIPMISDRAAITIQK